MRLSARLFHILHDNRWSLLLLVLLPCFWWWPLLAGYLPHFMDTVTLQYPMRLAAARQIHDGVLPLWLPNIMSGVPLAANPEVAIWYPPNALFFAVPGTVSYGLVLVFHYILAGWGSFFLARRLGCMRTAALFAGLTLQFGSFLVSHIALPPLVFSMPWLVWMFLAVEHDVEKPRGRLVTPGSLAVALLFCFQFLAGAAQLTYFSALALPAYWLLRGATMHGARVLPGLILRGAIAALLALGLSAIQFLPTLDFLLSSERSAGLDPEELQEQALNGEFLWRALIGGTGQMIEDTDSIHAIGLGALLVVPLAFFRRRTRRPGIALLAVGLFGYLLAMGPLVPVWAGFLPMYENFHAPRRALVLWSVAGPVIAGLGLHNLFLILKVKRLPGWLMPVSLAVLFLPNILMLPRLERVFTKLDPFMPHEDYSEILGEDRYLTLDPSFRYAHGSRAKDYGLALLPNLAAWHDLQDIQGYSPLILRRYGIARNMAVRRSGNFYPSHATLFTDPNSAVLRYTGVRYLIGRFDLFDPSRVLPGTTIDHERLAERIELVHPHPRWPLWRYRIEYPMAWLPRSILLQETPGDALRTALSMKNPYVAAYGDFESPPAAPLSDSVFGAGSLFPEDAGYQNARMFVVRLAEPAGKNGQAVVAAISWHLGWKARTDEGVSLATFPVNAFNTAVIAPPGTREIRLVYSPRAFWQGFGITLASLVLFVLLCFRLGRRVEKQVVS